MDFTTIGLRVKTLTGEEASSIGGFTSAQLSAAVDDANLDVSMDTMAIEGIGSVDTVSGTYQYNLSASYMCPDYLGVRAIYWNNLKLKPTRLEGDIWGYGDTKGTGQPLNFRVWNGKIELDPTPSEAKTMQVYYYKKPTNSTTVPTGSPEVGSQYHMAIVYLACAYLTLKNNDDIKNNKFYQLYQARINRLRKTQMQYYDNVIPNVNSSIRRRFFR